MKTSEMSTSSSPAQYHDVLEDTNINTITGDEIPKQHNGKKLSSDKLRRNDSLDLESRHFPGQNHHGSKVSPLAPYFSLHHIIRHSFFGLLNMTYTSVFFFKKNQAMITFVF